MMRTGLHWPNVLRAAAVALAAAAVLAGCGARGPFTVHVAAHAPGRQLPPGFFGVGAEYDELPIYERAPAAVARVLKLLTVPGDGPLSLRIGGTSADLTYWRPARRALPAGAFTLTPAWFTATGRLIRTAGLKVIVDLNLHGATIAQSLAQARASEQRLPPGSIAAFQLGNEPDKYQDGYLPPAYVRSFAAEARGLQQIAPGTPLIGPAVTSAENNFTWLKEVLAGTKPELGALDAHQYALGACDPPSSPAYPTIARVLSNRSSAGLAAQVKPAVELAHAAGRPFRLDEMNSVTCGGRPGVSDTFATALWAPDALFALLDTGLDAVNVHLRPTKVNGALTVDGAGIAARPLLYGLLLFAHALSPGGHLVPVTLAHAPSPQVRVWAVRTPGGALHVLVINKTDRPVRSTLALSGAHTASVQRLLAPSVRATGGVTLAGQRLDAAGQLTGRRIVTPLRRSRAGFPLTVPADSAALVTTS